MSDISTFNFYSTAKGLPAGKSNIKYLRPTNCVLFSKVLEERIPKRYNGHPELVHADIKRAFDYRASHKILGTQTFDGKMAYDFYIGILFYNKLKDGRFSQSYTAPHGAFIFICIDQQTSSVTQRMFEIQEKDPHGGDYEMLKNCRPEYNGIFKDGKFIHFGKSAYADNFHELGHVLNVPCSHSDANDNCSIPIKSLGLDGVYIDSESELANALSMLRATAYNDLNIDVDKLGKDGYRKVLEALMADPDYDVKEGREFGRIQNYIKTIGIERFLKVAEPYLPAIL